MKMTKTKICAIALTGALAVSAMSIGFAEWKTDITASGSAVTANGKWEVVVTAADLKVSNGSSLSNTKTETATEYNIARTGTKDDTLIASLITADYPTSWVDASKASLIGTQSDQTLSQYTYYYAVDTSKCDLTDLNTLTDEQRSVIVENETTVTVSDEICGYYRYVSGDSSNGTSAGAAASAAKVVDGFLKDMDALLREQYPDTYQNYVIASIGSALPSMNYIMAEYKATTTSKEVETDEAATISEDGTSVNYADVAFTMPGAWAEYSLTVTNNGTVDANLSDVTIALESESEQLALDKPDLEGKVLKAGESCTITFTVYVPETVEGELNAAGTLTVKLPYAQAEIEERPTPAYTQD